MKRNMNQYESHHERYRKSKQAATSRSDLSYRFVVFDYK